MSNFRNLRTGERNQKLDRDNGMLQVILARTYINSDDSPAQHMALFTSTKQQDDKIRRAAKKPRITDKKKTKLGKSNDSVIVPVTCLIPRLLHSVFFLRAAVESLQLSRFCLEDNESKVMINW